MNHPQYELVNICHLYGKREVLNIPHLVLEKGKIYGIVGPNGSGKSTLLYILNGLITPTEGMVYFEGKPLPSSLNTLGKRTSITLVIQNPYLFNTTVEKNIEYGLKVQGMSRKMRKSVVQRIIEKLELRGLEKRPAKELSGGESKLVALARALVIDPQVILLDEPTSGMDLKHLQKFENILIRINRERKTTIIFTTHDLCRAYILAHQVFSLVEGHLISSTVHNLFKGRVKTSKEGVYFDTGNLKIWISPCHRGSQANYATIDPDKIIISPDPFSSSARNIFRGRISKIIEQKEVVSLEIKGEETFLVQITKESLEKMALTPGSSVYLAFKAMSVNVF
jgi:tungstate transport system ATP-binding protein